MDKAHIYGLKLIRFPVSRYYFRQYSQNCNKLYTTNLLFPLPKGDHHDSICPKEYSPFPTQPLQTLVSILYIDHNDILNLMFLHSFFIPGFFIYLCI